jgi:hypothetical protein
MLLMSHSSQYSAASQLGTEYLLLIVLHSQLAVSTRQPPCFTGNCESKRHSCGLGMLCAGQTEAAAAVAAAQHAAVVSQLIARVGQLSR